MRALLSVFAGVALIANLHAGDKSPESIRVELGWRVCLDTRGHPVSLQAIPNERVNRVPQIRARLEREIRSWQFRPGTLDGIPEPTDTALYVRATLSAAPNDTIHIRVDSANTGVDREKMVVPHYPGVARTMKIVGEVVLRVGYDASGNVTSTELEPGGPKADRSLVDASTQAARKWKFRPDSIGGHAIAGYVITPFCYNLRYRYGGGIPGKCDWKLPGSRQTLRDGETLALNPSAKLLTAVAGRSL